MMVILGIFDKMMEALTNVFKLNNENRVKDLWLIVQVLGGAAIGLKVFADVIDFLLANYPYQTMFWFSGLILMSIPSLRKSELREHKLDLKFTLLGILLIGTLVYLNPGKADYDYRELVYPMLTVVNLIVLFVVGMIGGATMLFPGVSGSMVLLIIGQYYIFVGLIKSVTEFNLVKLVMLAFIMLGILVGIYLSAKITDKLLKDNRRTIISFIIGLIIMSSLVLLPNSVISLTPNPTYDLMLVIACIISFIFGGVIIQLITVMQRKKELN
jgi:putative membrane protein